MSELFPVRCGTCDADLNPADLAGVFGVFTPSGNVLAGRDRGVHRCPSVTKEDEAAALRLIAESWL